MNDRSSKEIVAGLRSLNDGNYVCALAADEIERLQSLITEHQARQLELCHEVERLTALVPAEPLGGGVAAPPAESLYELVGYQYKFHNGFGHVMWNDSPADYNGSRYVEHREIYAKRAEVTKEVGQ